MRSVTDENDASDANATPAQAGDRLQPGTVPLPGDEETWTNTILGHPSEWPTLLHSIVVTLSSFDYPSAIFWGQELVLLYNDAWAAAGGITEQAKKQRGSLGADAWHGLQTALVGGKPARLNGNDLLRSTNGEYDYTVLASPLFDKNIHEPQGVITQLIPSQKLHKLPAKQSYKDLDGAEPSTMGNKDLDRSVVKSKASSADNVPLDEHPFFHRFAEMLPTGLAILDHEALAVFVNQHFYALTTHRGPDQSFRSWPQSIHPDDYDRVLGAYHQAFVYQRQLRTEFRALGGDRPWRLLLLTPLGDENLRHVSLEKYGGFICCVVDITSEKSAELTQRNAANEARERKEQQERFIDMISHEIRNPLSAVLHCVEDIEEAVKTGVKEHTQISEILEATETINLCIAHQKNIVDDVLSYSKLDSSMLALVPKPSKPDHDLSKSIHMFQPELRKQHCEFEYKVDKEYHDFNIDWVMADLARIGQVLINLVSNSIKFTSKTDGEKKISCRVSAAKSRPSSFPPDVVFFETEKHVHHMDATGRSEWGEGEPLYIMFAVKDTGIGISEEGKKRLFQRFKQATPKTGEIYGGSGLGLNISRKLVHMHGGEIGVDSIEGQGTTFAFFFRVRRSGPPEDGPQVEIDRHEQLKGEIQSQGLTAGSDHKKNKSEEGSSRQHGKKQDGKIKKKDEDLSQDATYATAQGTTQDHLANTAASMEKVTSGYKKSSADPMDEAGKLQRDHHSDRPQQLGRTKTEQEAQEQEPDNPLRRRKSHPHILLVEDNLVNQRIVARKLRSKDFVVSTAENGREAVDAYVDCLAKPPGDSQRYDLILMDKEMPEMDGNTATRKIREIESEKGVGKRNGVAVLGLSANVRGEQQDAMISAGMDAVISKPYKVEDLIGKINYLMERTSSNGGDGGDNAAGTAGRGESGNGGGRSGDGGEERRQQQQQQERERGEAEVKTPVDKPGNKRPSVNAVRSGELPLRKAPSGDGEGKGYTQQQQQSREDGTDFKSKQQQEQSGTESQTENPNQNEAGQGQAKNYAEAAAPGPRD
ncbi:hypothetical protein MBLNU230_g7114t1 [Neophaeotheca triangularis]